MLVIALLVGSENINEHCTAENKTHCYIIRVKIASFAKRKKKTSDN